MPENINLQDVQDQLKSFKTDIVDIIKEKTLGSATKEEIDGLKAQLQDVEKHIQNLEEQTKAAHSATANLAKTGEEKFNFGALMKGAINEFYSRKYKSFVSDGDPFKDCGHEIEMLKAYHAETKAVTAGDGTGASYIIPVEFVPDIVDLTIANMPIMDLGPNVLRGLTGPLSLPKVTGRHTAHWVGEIEEPTSSDVTLGQMSMTPHKVGVVTTYSKELQYQSRDLIDQIVKEKVSEAMALKMESGHIEGTGTNKQPKGIVNYSGFTTGPTEATNGIRFSFDKAANMIQLLDVANELKEVGNYGFLTRPEIMWGLKRERVINYSGQTQASGTPIGGYMNIILNKQGVENALEYKMRTSTLLSKVTKGTATLGASPVIFGNWKQFYIGFWRNLEIKVSDIAYANSTSAFSQDAIHVAAFWETDCNVGRSTAFVKVADALTSF